MIIWVFHSVGREAELRQRLNNFVKGEVSGIAHSLNNLGPISSGPLALCGFKEHSTCHTSDSEKEREFSWMVGKGRLWGSGKEDVLAINTELKN